MATAPALRGRPVLRRAHARRDRRPRRALAGARRRPPASRRGDRGAVRARAAARPRRERRRPPAPRHVPLDLGRARGRGLARAEASCTRASASSCRPPTPQRLGVARRRPRRRRLERPQRPRHRGAARRDAARQRRSCRRRSPEDSASRARRPARGGAQGMTPGAPARRRRLRRAVVDADPQVARDLRRRPADRPGRCSCSSASCSAASRTATAPTASARSASLPAARRHRASCSTRSSSARAPRSASCSRSRRSSRSSPPSRRFAIVPFGDTVDIFGTQVGLYGIDVSIGPLYLFAFGAIAFYGLMLGGWASGSKYSFLGAMRAAAQLISYEVAQGLSLVGVIITAGTLSLDRASSRPRQGMWYIVPQFVGFLDLHGRRLRRDQPRRRSTSPRPTPSWSAATTPSTAAGASPPTTSPSTSTS